MHRTTLTILALALMVAPLTADAEYSHLCTSVPGACEYTGPDAPKLGLEVCYERSSNTARLKNTASCPANSLPFSVGHGEVIDPQTGQVAAYMPLGDACAARQCAEYVAHEGGEEYVICCENGGPCWPGGDCGGVLYWCFDGVCNEDGTVDCFEADEGL
ncbi:hypothetical protein ENSA5_50830 [Enhygromyxa salina]|uniref:Uncharacterized protein n=1 Tax=Enhygromyxa salina TaxID=215803 RepID=A0A2S9XGY3_9BACT|nr:hypothetical protein [Enhygromyxa salina]PRP92136.1 hypothetical protein ENSA5_50830 [Enhygromyxa salina]